MNFKNDKELFDTMEQKLYSSVISDVVDKLGYMHQAMRANINPMWPGAVVAGRAHTCLSVDVYETKENHYAMEIEAVDTLKPNDVLVGGTNCSTETALWGELLSTASRARGARGAIVDGYTRDLVRIQEMQFPMFATGTRPLDSMGRSIVLEYGHPVMCGEVLVKEGEIVFADIDGVIVIPKEIEEEAIRLAFEKVQAEDTVREELLKGHLLGDVYKKYGVL
ncbi:MAG: RraA family protein [Dehalococcoidia bacterium]|nr:RraA family protein [Dehalococcoidia bacterium]